MYHQRKAVGNGVQAEHVALSLQAIPMNPEHGGEGKKDTKACI